MNGPWSPAPSSATFPGAVAKAMRAPPAAETLAGPLLSGLAEMVFEGTAELSAEQRTRMFVIPSRTCVIDGDQRRGCLAGAT